MCVVKTWKNDKIFEEIIIENFQNLVKKLRFVSKNLEIKAT